MRTHVTLFLSEPANININENEHDSFITLDIQTSNSVLNLHSISRENLESIRNEIDNYLSVDYEVPLRTTCEFCDQKLLINNIDGHNPEMPWIWLSCPEYITTGNKEHTCLHIPYTPEIAKQIKKDGLKKELDFFCPDIL